MITIYHNPRCRKSRECNVFLNTLGKEVTVVNYLEDRFNKKTLGALIDLLKIAPIDLVRTNEAIWKTEYKGKSLSDDDIIVAMAENPKLIERPIVVHNQKAVIGRPLERVHSIL